jgi:hypothetical protein
MQWAIDGTPSFSKQTYSFRARVQNFYASPSNKSLTFCTLTCKCRIIYKDDKKPIWTLKFYQPQGGSLDMLEKLQNSSGKKSDHHLRHVSEYETGVVRAYGALFASPWVGRERKAQHRLHPHRVQRRQATLLLASFPARHFRSLPLIWSTPVTHPLTVLLLKGINKEENRILCFWIFLSLDWAWFQGHRAYYS